MAHEKTMSELLRSFRPEQLPTQEDLFAAAREANLFNGEQKYLTEALIPKLASKRTTGQGVVMAWQLAVQDAAQQISDSSRPAIAKFFIEESGDFFESTITTLLAQNPNILNQAIELKARVDGVIRSNSQQQT